MHQLQRFKRRQSQQEAAGWPTFIDRICIPLPEEAGGVIHFMTFYQQLSGVREGWGPGRPTPPTLSATLSLDAAYLIARTSFVEGVSRFALIHLLM